MEELQFEKFAIEEEGVFTSNYKVWNAKRTLIAEAKGILFSKSKDVYFYDNHGSELSHAYSITRSGFFTKEYQIKKDNITQAVLSKISGLFTSEFVINCPGQSPITLSGNMRKNNYVMIHEGVEIAKISRQRAIFTKDVYGTAIRADYDYRIAICIIIVLDIIIDIERQK